MPSPGHLAEVFSHSAVFSAFETRGRKKTPPGPLAGFVKAVSALSGH